MLFFPLLPPARAIGSARRWLRRVLCTLPLLVSASGCARFGFEDMAPPARDAGIGGPLVSTGGTEPDAASAAYRIGNRHCRR